MLWASEEDVFRQHVLEEPFGATCTSESCDGAQRISPVLLIEVPQVAALG